MSGQFTKYKNLTNEAIPLVKVKSIAPAPMIIITDPPEEEEKVLSDEELPTIPGGITVVPCSACSINFERTPNCEQCGGLRIVHSLAPTTKE